MSGTDCTGFGTTNARWKSWLPLAGVIALIAVGAFFVRQFSGPRTAEAQAPSRAPATARQSPAAPAARSAAGAPVREQQTATAPTGRGPSASAAKSLKVMAVVNGEQITRQELARECLRRYGKDVLEGMLNKQLIADACAQQGIEITQQDLNDEVERIAAKFGLPTTQWLQMLEDERGFSPEDYRQEVIWPMLAMRKLSQDQLQVNQQDLQKAIESDYGPKVKARLIVATSKAKADELYRKVAANPESFNEVAKEGDDPAVASARGMIPLIRKNVGDPKIEQAAFSLKPGQISSVIYAANQYFIIKCEQQIAETVLDRAQLEQVKKVMTDRIKEQKTRTAATDLFERLQKEAKVENVFNDEKKQQQHPGVAALINGQPISVLQLSEECLLRHGREILDGEINRKILTQELTRKRHTVTQDDLNGEVARTAEMYGFVKSNGQADIEKWLAHVEKDEGAPVELYLRDAVWPAVALRKLVGNKVEVTDEDLKKGFESNYGPRVEVQAIVLGDHRQAQKVWDQARNQPTEQYFAQLAQHHSTEPVSRANGGKVPPIRRYGGQGAIEDEAFRLKPGELSGIVAMGDRFIIMRCLGRTKPVGITLQEARAELTHNLQEQKLRMKMTEEMDQLKESAQIENFLAGIKQSGSRLKAAAASSLPPASNRAPAAKSAAAGKYDVVPATATRPTTRR
jgi:parvulin-like peptidyl-prolyl isomerase